MFCIISFFSINCYADFFSKVIIWGHPLHSHTHSYIHWGFFRAFEHLGYEVHWVNDKDEIQNFDLGGALFITEGQVDGSIPKRKDCYYILHNCKADEYRDLLSSNRCISLQVYTHDCIPHTTEKLGECMYTNVASKIIFLPWATDLLPYEIEACKASMTGKKDYKVTWIGTIGGGFFGNRNEIMGFEKACQENNIFFEKYTNVSTDKNIELIQKSYLAPALQGAWQCEKGYIPCRIFKNISYGQWGITNNKTVYDLFDGRIIYNPDTYQLFYDAQDYIKVADINELYELMDFVKNNHTYINRIKTLLSFMQKALDIKDDNESK
jgi:hypothetical protein